MIISELIKELAQYPETTPICFGQGSKVVIEPIFDVGSYDPYTVMLVDGEYDVRLKNHSVSDLLEELSKYHQDTPISYPYNLCVTYDRDHLKLDVQIVTTRSEDDLDYITSDQQNVTRSLWQRFCNWFSGNATKTTSSTVENYIVLMPIDAGDNDEAFCSCIHSTKY
jgi:hypothetical protein